ncbi:hydantoinase/oxoprolinase family protein [bacterium]|nr:MAG: hydantoinase/oxoprolinase family protein [bacterium]
MRIGVDTGGTFTDLVLLEDSGRATQLKVASTPDDPARALVEGIRQLLEGQDQAGGVRGAPKMTPRSVAHGTTVATNAMLEQRFSSLALLTTRGFRHVLEIARQSVPSGYGNSYFWVKPDRIVPLERVREVTERLDFRGAVLTPFDDEDARTAARWVRESGIKAVAVCFLHAYANPAHERRMRDVLLEQNPDVLVSISSEVWPEYREYERAVTTLVDAFVKPHVNGYLARAERKLEEIAPQAPLLIMKSNGGVLSAAGVARRPISTALSGPAAGALGASWLARQAGYERVITLDTGGTSTDVCLVEAAEPQLTRDGRIGPFPVRMPMIDIVSIGTGGGSIAWIAPDGGLRVGPRSAGAVPGPMAYGAGGREPTVTDAHVVLRRLPAAIAGSIQLDASLAAQGVQAIAARLGLTLERAAEGILQLSAHNQANAVLQLTVKRGIDPSGDVLVAFGGAGPLQAAQIAELLGLRTVLVPPSPGNVSAFGLLAVDLKDDYVITRVQRHDGVDEAAVAGAFESLEQAARESLAAQGVPESRMVLQRSVDTRYLGEAHEISIPVSGAFDAAGALERFHSAHERIYGYAYRDGDHVVEFVNWKLTGIGLIDRPRLGFELTRPARAAGGSGRPSGERGGFAVYRREALPAGFRADGPAIIDEYGSTTVVDPGFSLEVDRLGNLVLTR